MKKIFKYVFVSGLSLATVLSCDKVQEADTPDVVPPAKPEEITTIEAYIVPEDEQVTKTNYEIAGGTASFKWLEGDNIDVAVSNTDKGTVSSIVFTLTDVENCLFKDGQIQGYPAFAQLSGCTLSDWAFYPSRISPEAQEYGFAPDWTYEGGIFTIDLPSEITPPSSKPMAVVPLSGKRTGEGKYAFTQMTGVLAVPVSGLSGSEDFISLTSEGAALSGSFTINTSGAVAVVEQSGVQTKNDAGLTLKFNGLSGDRIFYFPLPAGVIPAGMVLTVGESSDPDTWMSKKTLKAIQIQRGVISQTPAIPYAAPDQQWEAWGTATFKDDFLWTYNTGFGSLTGVTVNVERSGRNPKRFRINNPYTATGYTPYTSGVVADEYLFFTVEDDGSVALQTFRSGVEDKASSGYPMLINGSSNSKVVSYTRDGDFYEIQIGVLYTKYEDSSYKYTKNNPAALHLTRILAETFTKVADGTFIDEKIWSLQGWGSATIPIELYQSDISVSRFRVPNPYLIAKEQFAYTTYTEGISGDPYLAFSIGDGDAVVFDTFNAGIEDKASGGKAMKVWYPLDFGSSYTTAAAGNLVASYRSDGLPAKVELYPIYSGVSDVSYKYTDQKTLRVRLNFQEAETWTDVAQLRYKDDFIFNNRHGKPADSNVPVTLQQSSVDPNRYRIANPYPALCDALGVTKYTTDISEYLVMTVDSEGKITYEELRPGVGDSSKELAICEPSDWNTRSGGSTVTGNSRVDAFDASGIPAVIRLYGVYHQVGNYIPSGTSGNYLYTRDNDQYGDVIVMAKSFPLDAWESIGTGRFRDKLVWSCAGLTDYAEAEFQQNTNYPAKFRIRKPYPGDGSDEWFQFDVTDPDNVTSTKYYLDYDVTAEGKETYKPYIWNGYYTNEYSKVLVTQDNGLPAVVELGPCYRKEPWTSYDYEIGRDHEDLAIEIIFPGCAPYISMSVEPYQSPVISKFHLPVAKLTLNNASGNLERMVIKITGGDYSKMSGLRLYQGGWMDSDYVAPDANGVVTMTNFTNAKISSSIDLNFWINDDSMIGSSFRFDIQEVVVDGNSIEVVQDKDYPHFPGIRVNHGGDKATIRPQMGEETITSFRIPALVTAKDGTLVAAYDIRYDSSTDLQRDIDVGFKRSTDGGKTWSDLGIAMDMGTYGYEDEVAAGTMTWKNAQLNNGIGDPCLLVDDNTGDIFCFAVWANGHYSDSDNRCLAWAGTGFEIDQTPQLMMVKSTDNGATWSQPVNLTRQIKKQAWRMTFQGPGRGITMADGTLVIPIQHQEGASRNMHGLYPLNSGIAYSKDHGETWHAHNSAHPVTSEACVAEIEPGVFMLSMRDETDSHARRVYTTSDLGRSWTAHSSNGKILDPTCEASILNVSAADNSLGKDIVIFSNPANTGRSRMTIKISEDKGATWPHELLIDSGGSQYSCLTMVDQSTVGILYESSRGNILFQAIPLSEIVK